MQKRIDIIITGECEVNCWHQKLMLRNIQISHPNKRVFKRLLLACQRNGNVAYEKMKRQKSIVGMKEMSCTSLVL